MGTTYIYMDATGPLLGIYFGIITFLVFLFLDRVNGEAVKINNIYLQQDGIFSESRYCEKN